jgi:ubiquinol-cytochrome c reductase cytochrome b subunit
MRIIDYTLINQAYRSGVIYAAPVNLSYFWNFGIYGLLCLGIQIVSGIALAMHYIPDIDLAFYTIQHIMRDINNGALLRYFHVNGASAFFIVIYIHTFRGIYYNSFTYPRENLWIIGVVILLLMIVTAFLGYVLPWGQMSYWGATVITNLFSSIPIIGNYIVLWLWGGFSVDGPTLTRFYALHYLMPFIIMACVLIHMLFLHSNGSNNPLGISMGSDGGIAFSPYYIQKDLLGVIIFGILFIIFIFWAPELSGHPDNYIPGTPLVTPTHIVPEWYFLPFYAILRSIPDKLTGVIALALAIISLLILPFIHKPLIRSTQFKPINKMVFWVFVSDCLVLGWIGSQPIEYPYLAIGQIASILYFAYFFIIMPLLIKLEIAIINSYSKD